MYHLQRLDWWNNLKTPIDPMNWCNFGSLNGLYYWSGRILNIVTMPRSCIIGEKIAALTELRLRMSRRYQYRCRGRSRIILNQQKCTRRGPRHIRRTRTRCRGAFVYSCKFWLLYATQSIWPSLRFLSTPTVIFHANRTLLQCVDEAKLPRHTFM